MGGMLEFLEDIIGTSRFKDPIKQFASKVAEMNEMRIEKLNRVKLVEKEKDELEGPMKEALESLRLENSRAVKVNIKFQHTAKEMRRKIETLQTEKTDIESNATDITTQLKQIHD